VLDTVRRATEAGMAVAIHCAAGLGRTGTVLAAYFVAGGLSSREAVEKVRDLRPGSIETVEQERAIERFAARVGRRSAE
jgi:atypical dual specificity phosphatase